MTEPPERAQGRTAGVGAFALLLLSVVGLTLIAGQLATPRDAPGALPDPAVGEGGGPTYVLGSTPTLTPPEAIAASLEGTWVANPRSDTISRVDPVGLEVTGSIAVGRAPIDVAVGDGLLWAVTLDDSVLWRIDPQTMEVTGTVAMPEGPSAVEVADGVVWVLSAREPALTRVDPDTLEVAASTELRPWPQGLAVGGGAVWVSFPGVVDDDAEVWRVDAGTLEITTRTPVVGHPRSLAVAGQHVWVATDDSNVITRLDPETGDVSDQLLGRPDPYVVTTSPDGGEVWVLYGQFQMLARLDPVTGDELGSVRPGAAPVAVAARGDGHAWIANVAGGGPAGGRVTLVGPEPPA